MTRITDVLPKLASQSCSDRAAEARIMKDQANEFAKAMLEHIADTWDRIAKQLKE